MLSDVAAMLTGSLGMLPSASLGDADPKTGKRKALYEPVHGSAPDIAGKGLANPIAMIGSFGMALRYSFGLGEAADRLDAAIASVLASGLRTRTSRAKAAASPRPAKWATPSSPPSSASAECSIERPAGTPSRVLLLASAPRRNRPRARLGQAQSLDHAGERRLVYCCTCRAADQRPPVRRRAARAATAAQPRSRRRPASAPPTRSPPRRLRASRLAPSRSTRRRRRRRSPPRRRADPPAAVRRLSSLPRLDPQRWALAPSTRPMAARRCGRGHAIEGGSRDGICSTLRPRA